MKKDEEHEQSAFLASSFFFGEDVKMAVETFPLPSKMGGGGRKGRNRRNFGVTTGHHAGGIVKCETSSLSLDSRFQESKPP